MEENKIQKISVDSLKIIQNSNTQADFSNIFQQI